LLKVDIKQKVKNSMYWWL